VNENLRLDYVNRALVRIGDAPLSALLEGEAGDEAGQASAADVALLVYEPTVRELLSRRRWEFACVQAQLARLEGVSPLVGWTYAYQFPTEPPYLRLARLAYSADSLSLGSSAAVITSARRGLAYAIRASDDGKHVYLLSHWSDVFVEYVGRVEEVLFSASFGACVVLGLAIKMAQALTDDTDLVKQLNIELYGDRARGFTGALTMAKLEDSQNSPNPGFADDAGFVSGR